MVKILVADDDKVMLGLLETLMELEGNSVITVTRPEQIVPTAQAENVALILMDYHLTGGDSMNALKELKSNPALAQIPVLVASGMDRKMECMAAGADGFILKPFRPAALLAEMQSILSKQQSGGA
ncbi:MAG: response regulator transcription factor [Anaerolineae bacterium]|nr:response regulator transcription factor [Anaerolineae bacterium]